MENVWQGGCKGACQRLPVLRGIAIVQPIATPLATRIAHPFGLQDSTALKRGRRIRHLFHTLLTLCLAIFVSYSTRLSQVLFSRVASRSRDHVQHRNVGIGLKSAPLYLSMRPLEPNPFPGFSVSLLETSTPLYLSMTSPYAIAPRANTFLTLMEVREYTLSVTCCG